MIRTILSIVPALMLISCLGGPALATSTEDPDDRNEFLELDIVTLMKVTVTTASKREQTLADVPAAIFVITQDDIRRSGVRSIPDALAMAPGIQVAKVSNSTWSVSSRGFPGYTSNKLLILLDGRSIYSPSFSGTIWDSQSVMLEDVDRIEVIRGPGGTLWGANAVNGIINIITKSAKDTQGGLVRVGLGEEGMLTGALRYGGKVGETTFGRIYLNYLEEPQNTLKDDNLPAYDGWRPIQGGFRLDGKANAHADWTLQGDLLDNREDILISPYWIDQYPYQSALEDRVAIQRSNLLGRWQQKLGGKRSLTLQGYYDAIDYSWEKDGFQQNIRTIDLDMQFESPLGARQFLSTGVGFRSIQGRFQATPMLSLADDDNSVYSTFLQDEITLWPDTLTLTLGTKYEHNSYTGSEWQPSARLLWKPVPRHTFWTSVARAVRTPTALERSGRALVQTYPLDDGNGNVIAGSFNLVGNADFQSETLIAYEAGYRWQARENLAFDLAIFYNDYDDLYTVSEPKSSPPVIDIWFTNGFQASAKGFEWTADWKATSWLGLAFSYSYMDMYWKTDTNSLTGVTGGALTGTESGTPQHQASGRATIALAKDWQLNLWLRYVGQLDAVNGSNPLNPPLSIESYFLLNSAIIWTPCKDLEITLAGLNLLDASKFQYPMENLIAPTEIGRSIYGKIVWRF